MLRPKPLIKYFSILFLCLSSALGLILYLFFVRERESQLLITKTNEESHVKVQEILIAKDFKSIFSDLIFISKMTELKLNNFSNEQLFSLLKQEYLEFSKRKKIYDQIRFLDESGMEIIRVNFNKDRPFVVPENQLQSKGDRYYFTDAIALSKEQISISPFDLNVENGKIEQPLKPTIRFATPVFNRNGEKKGIAISNYLGDRLLAGLTETNLTSLGEIMLLNSEGYWLKGPNPEDEWGFMFPEKQDRTFANAFPEVWQKIENSNFGQFQSDRGLFTFSTVYPLLGQTYSQSEDLQLGQNPKSYYWKIVSYVPPEILNASSQRLAREMLRLYGALLILTGIVSAGTAQIIVQRQQALADLKQSQEFLRQAAYVKDKLKSYVCSQIRNSLELSQILATSIEQIRQLLHIDRCTFSWYRPDGDPSLFDVVRESKTERAESLLGVYPATVLGVLGKKLLDLETIEVDDVEKIGDPAAKKFLQSHGFSSILILPIQTRSGQLGILTCGHCGGARPWNDEELELLAGVSEQLAVALNQAELYQESHAYAVEAQTKAQQLQATLEELQATQTQLIQTEKMSSLGQMVAGIAHEINNPVSFIYGNLAHADEYVKQLFQLIELYREHYPHPVAEIEDYSEEIEWEFLKEDLPKLCSSLKVGANRIKSIVLSLRNFSRLDEAQMKSVDLHEGIDSTLLILQNRLSNDRGINLVKQYGEIPKVECYASQVNQVFINIINNAIDALESYNASLSTNGRGAMAIVISTERIHPDFVTITIADNGPGISNEVKQRIFDPFFTTKPIGKGTGLGLSISYEIIVQKHKGSIECISEPGKGTKFIINLPLRPEPKLTVASR